MKTTSSTRAFLILLLAGSVLLAACSNQAKATTAPEATFDAGPIYTQAAQTIEANFRQTEAARPTSTPEPSATPEPTQQPEQPTATSAPAEDQATPTATSAGITAPTVTATPTTAALIIPTATRATSGGVVATATPPVDRAELVSLSPARGIKVQRNASFDLTVTVKNTGGFTWKQYAYALRYSRGDQLGPTDFVIQKDVKPGESYSFVFTITAPDSTGPKQVYWALTDGDRRELMWIDYNIEVTD